ncbi:MAG: aspartate aminotransferase family protein [Bacteroidetes bacterium]|nr:MAG: aspartate aminotransferase family protein [Bacteroidota bacterium]
MNNRQLFYNFLGQTSQTPLAIEIERAEGIFMYGPDGKKYMDLISGISVSNVGHCHPEIVEAVQQQAERYMHLMVYGEFVQSPQVKLAEFLVSQLPDTLNNVYLVNSGSEAIEGAMKLAKRYTGRSEIIAFRNAYHGSTQGSLSVMGDENMKNAFRPLLPGIRFLDFNDREGLNQINSSTACVMAETIQGEAGALVPEADFLKEVREACNRNGSLLVLDEIQAGCGRSGSMWAFQQFGIVPDILTLAKGMGGGLPIGAFISSRQIMHSLTHEPILGHITTFGGNAICASAALANLNIIVREKLWENAARQEMLFRELLTHPKIKSIHGKGLMLALEFETFEVNKRIIDRLIEKGIVTDWFLFAPHCLRIAPPLIIKEEEVKTACNILLETLDEIE